MHFKIQISGANTDRCNILCKTSFVCDKKRIIGSNEINDVFCFFFLALEIVQTPGGFTSSCTEIN